MEIIHFRSGTVLTQRVSHIHQVMAAVWQRGQRVLSLESRTEKRRWRSRRAMSLTSNGGLKQTSAHQTAAICMQPFDVTRWLSASWWVLSALKGSAERYGLTQPLNSNRNTPTRAERPPLWLFNLNFHPLSYVKDFIRLSFFFFFFLNLLCSSGFAEELERGFTLAGGNIWSTPLACRACITFGNSGCLKCYRGLQQQKKSPASIWSPTTLLCFYSLRACTLDEAVPCLWPAGSEPAHWQYAVAAHSHRQ